MLLLPECVMRHCPKVVLGSGGSFNYAVDVAVMGLGAKAERPWMDPPPNNSHSQELFDQVRLQVGIRRLPAGCVDMYLALTCALISISGQAMGTW